MYAKPNEGNKKIKHKVIQQYGSERGIKDVSNRSNHFSWALVLKQFTITVHSPKRILDARELFHHNEHCSQWRCYLSILIEFRQFCCNSFSFFLTRRMAIEMVCKLQKKKQNDEILRILFCDWKSTHLIDI